MRNSTRVASVLCTLACLSVSALSHGQGMPPPRGPESEPPIGTNAPAFPPVERIGDGIFRIGKVTIDRKQRLVSFPASVNQAQGLLEYVLVRTGGKTHESLLRTDAEPYDIQLACLLLNLSGTDRPIAHQGANETPTGDPVRLSITLNNETIMPEQWLIQTSNDTKQDVPPLNWLFTGSLISEGRFMAQTEGSIIALFHDPFAILDHASKGGESDRVWFVKEGALPPPGTPVTLTISVKP